MKALSREDVFVDKPLGIITRKTACKALRLMDEWRPPEPALKVGDYVVVMNSAICELLGRYGKIVNGAYNSNLSVTFEVEFAQGYMPGGSHTPSLHFRTLDAKFLKKVP